jgi:hypothetical protein
MFSNPNFAAHAHAEIADLFPEPYIFQSAVDGKHEFLGVNGLGEIIKCPALHGLHRGFHRTKSGENDNGGGGELGLRMFENIEAGETGKHEIGEDKINWLAVESGEPLFAGSGADDAETVMIHAELHDTAEAGVVFNDEDRGFHMASFSWARGMSM